MSQNYYYPSTSAALTLAAIGLNGDPIPTSSILIGAENPSGDMQQLQADANGSLIVAVQDVDPGALFNINIQEVAGAAPSATNPLSIQLSDGSAYYQAATETTAAAILADTASLDAKIPAQGQALMAASMPVAIASNQSTLPVSAASLPLPTGAATEATLASIDGKTPALGQAAMAASVPVAIANNQSAIPVSASSLPLPSGAATEATLAAFSAKTAGALVPEAYDEIDITYVSGGAADGQIDTVTYSLAAAPVAVLTMSYDPTSGKLTNVTKT